MAARRTTFVPIRRGRRWLRTLARKKPHSLAVRTTRRAPDHIAFLTSAALAATLLSCAHAGPGARPASRPPATGEATRNSLPPGPGPDSLAGRPPGEPGAVATPADTGRATLPVSPDSGGLAPPPTGPVGALSPDSALGPAQRRHERADELFGRLTARGSYEIRSLASDVVLGREDWELFEDDAGLRTLRATSDLEVGGARASRSATVTVTPELAFVEADLGSSAAGVDSYATYRRTGDLLEVEAYGDASGETRQQVRFPDEGVFVSQLFATRGWELAAFERSEEATRPAYLAGSAPGVLLGEVRTFSARRVAQEDLRLHAGAFRTWRFEVPLSAGPAELPAPGGEGDDATVDRWWVTAGSRLPVAADLPSLGVRLELVDLAQNPEPAAPAAHGPVLARGLYQHRLVRRTEPIATETWTLSADADRGYLLESELVYADGSRLAVRAAADSSFRVRDVQVRRSAGRGGESSSITVGEGELRAEARGGPVGVAEQRLPLEGPVVFRMSAAALEGWAEVPAGSAQGTLTYWLPPGPHPLGTLVELPADVDLGEERLPTPARTFATRRYASPAETPPVFRTVRWIFDPYHLPARVLFPALGREAILVRYESGEPFK